MKPVSCDTELVRYAFVGETYNVVTEWMEADVDEPGQEERLNDDEIVANIVDDVNDVGEDSSGDKDVVDEPKVNPSEAFSASEVSL